MSEGDDTASPVEFTGRRWSFFWLLLRGYLLLIPTIGVYRFWLTTVKRRYYWQNTLIGGQPLEYTGSAVQLLIGFLFAVGLFLPLYGGFFYLSTQSSDIVLWGYFVVGILFWFAQGYAIYRARDFRLSRTLWRGIRFDQRGSAIVYAARRFVWSLLLLVTAGLAYPWMASSLWRYRYRNTWYGDRPFDWTGNWKTIAGPYFRAWLAVLIFLILGLFALASLRSSGGVAVALVGFVTGFAVLLAWLYFRAREATRMFSAIRIGAAALTVRVRMRTLLGQGLLYALFGAISLALFAAAVALIVTPAALTSDDLSQIVRAGYLTVTLLLGAYLVFLGALGIFGEIFLGFGFWAAVARGASVTGLESLDDVRAAPEDPSLAGEGLADALNVGAY